MTDHKPLFDEYERTDSAPMRDSSSPTGYVCVACGAPLTEDWEGEHEPTCSLPEVLRHPHR